MFSAERHDAYVAVDYTSASPTPHGGLVFRQVDANAYFLLDASGPTLYRNDYGHLQSLGTGGHTVRAGERHRLEVRLEGSTIDVYMDAAFQFRVSDWTYADGVSHGFYLDAPTDPGAVFDVLCAFGGMLQKDAYEDVKIAPGLCHEGCAGWMSRVVWRWCAERASTAPECCRTGGPRASRHWAS